MCQHKFKFERQSHVILHRKIIFIDVYRCQECKKLQIIDKDKCKIISLGGRMGEEITFNEV